MTLLEGVQILGSISRYDHVRFHRFFGLIFFIALSSWAGPIQDLGSGTPPALGLFLGPQSYVQTTAYRLTQPRLVYTNGSYFQERGWAVSEREILETFAWGIPTEPEPSSAFSKKEKYFYADRYGGDHIGRNFGSGRAATAGNFQIKGIGKTPLVSPFQLKDHNSGLVSANEAIREAVWGEINQELPYGANRVIALIDRGTRMNTETGEVVPNFMIVREDSVRPAHYLRAPFASGPLQQTDEARTKEALKFLEGALPVPKSKKRLRGPERIKEGLFEWVKRYAEQQATLFAHRLYHGAPSISNIEISGRLIDYGTQTSLPDYGPLRIVDIAAPAGSTADFTKRVVLFVDSVRSALPAKIRSQIPPTSVYVKHFEKHYQTQLRREFLLLTGISEEILDSKLLNRKEIESFADQLIYIGTRGGQVTMGRYTVPKKLTEFDLGKVLVELAEAFAKKDPMAFEKIIASNLEALGLLQKRRFRRSYETFLQHALDRGGDSNSRRQAFLKGAVDRNASRAPLHRWTMMDEIQEMLNEYTADGNAGRIQSYIDQKTELGRGNKPQTGGQRACLRKTFIR